MHFYKKKSAKMFEGKEGTNRNRRKKANRNTLLKQKRMHDMKAYLLRLLPLRCADWLYQQAV
jgi:hypothetical protein